MNDPSKPPAPAAPPSVAPTPSEPAAPPPGEEATAPHKLKTVAKALAKARRRTTAAQLLVKRGRAAEVRVPLLHSETIIGRDPACDIVLSETSVSRRHARIERDEGGYFRIVDLGSRNGVIVDGERVEAMILIDGDSFAIGDTQFTVAVGPAVGVGERV